MMSTNTDSSGSCSPRVSKHSKSKVSLSKYLTLMTTKWKQKDFNKSEIVFKGQTIEVTMTCLKLLKGDRIIFVFNDISKIQTKQKRRLEKKFKNIFLSSFSHNLNTPLNSLVINNQVLAKRFMNKDKKSY
jgi:hypothetical protein